MKLLYTLALISLLFVGCKEGTPEDDDSGSIDINSSCDTQLQTLESNLHVTLDAIDTDTPYSLLISREDGRSFTHSMGDFTPERLYKSASTAKMVAAVVILDVVAQGSLSLEDRVTQYIDFWPTTGEVSTITLRELLSFQSGLNTDPLCYNFGGYDFEKCVQNILTKNKTITKNQFYYGPNHLQVAALMAIKAAKASSWEELFNAFKAKFNLFKNSSFNLPSTTNPRIAGGMSVTAKEYHQFLAALYSGKILPKSLFDAMRSDQIEGISIVNSPALDGMNQDWHYGFGMWIESDSNPFDATKVTQKVSSAGLYGAYPFMDFKHHYYGIVAREGILGSYTKGYELFTQAQERLNEWADFTCNKE